MLSEALPVTDPALARAALQGLATMAGLIVAIGAQNALVLRQGLAGRHVLPVVALCTVSDWLLTAVGVFGLGGLIASSPAWLEACRYVGAAFLFVYGALAARRALSATASALAATGATRGLGATLAAAAAMTYLNPHVYLDTVVLMGTLGAQHPAAARAAFVMGAGAASLAWFSLLGFGALAASRWLRHARTWRAIDATVAVVMWWMALQLLLAPLQVAAG